ncbi:amino acid ABC transporter permease [Streptomyces spinoverrucosus]|uniref:amino acid ABC transporter permease n=1 Tax=Streptomyces spinoverrucosus TaxID=284043 RepID=UPI0018C38BC5|nr:amino acid ABC transporter permease [Streptomyces spinoverrucosus]MBG0853795.1 amino acid ABC transporter permease [Streptomyces spinoverrucosus]
MAWDEWEQLKADAGARGSTQMQLNQLGRADGSGEGPEGGGERLKHSAKPWNDAAQVADELRISTNRVRARLDSTHGSIKNKYELEHYGVSTGTNGLDSIDVLRSVLTSWEERLEAVRDECETLGPKLRQTARDLGSTDVKVKTDVDSVNVGSGDAKVR